MQGPLRLGVQGQAQANLGDAYRQLYDYREELGNPPLLVVCDLERFEVHTNFTGTAKKVHALHAR